MKDKLFEVLFWIAFIVIVLLLIFGPYVLDFLMDVLRLRFALRW